MGSFLPPATCAVAVAAAALVVLLNPIARFEDFRALPADVDSPVADQQHLASISGNGRWQMWMSAIDAAQEDPLRGLGAGSYESWWLEHGQIQGFVQNAHSLYFETLAELGGRTGILIAKRMTAAVSPAYVVERVGLRP